MFPHYVLWCEYVWCFVGYTLTNGIVEAQNTDMFRLGNYWQDSCTNWHSHQQYGRSQDVLYPLKHLGLLVFLSIPFWWMQMLSNFDRSIEFINVPPPLPLLLSGPPPSQLDGSSGLPTGCQLPRLPSPQIHSPYRAKTAFSNASIITRSLSQPAVTPLFLVQRPDPWTWPSDFLRPVSALSPPFCTPCSWRPIRPLGRLALTSWSLSSTFPLLGGSPSPPGEFLPVLQEWLWPGLQEVSVRGPRTGPGVLPGCSRSAREPEKTRSPVKWEFQATVKYVSCNIVISEATVTVLIFPSHFSLPSFLTCLPVKTADSTRVGTPPGLWTTVFSVPRLLLGSGGLAGNKNKWLNRVVSDTSKSFKET